MFGGRSTPDAQILDELVESPGAVVTGRRTYDVGIDEWGGKSPFRVPCFVRSHGVPGDAATEGSPFNFVTDGLDSALAQARAAAGDKDVWVMGGANVAQQFLRAGLLDEIQIHLVPVLLGDGTRLFDQIGGERVELERTRLIESPVVTHLRFRVVTSQTPRSTPGRPTSPNDPGPGDALGGALGRRPV